MIGASLLRTRGLLICDDCGYENAARAPAGDHPGRHVVFCGYCGGPGIAGSARWQALPDRRQGFGWKLKRAAAKALGMKEGSA